MNQFVTSTLCLLFLSCATTIEAAGFNTITVFGDSMSDGGDDITAVDSYYKNWGDPFAVTPPTPHVPSNDFRFAEDLVFAEYLAQYLDFYTSATFYNWAVGGQRASDFRGVLDDDYLSANGQASPDGLYIVALGQVDILTNSSTPAVTSTNVVDGIQHLYNNGARQFIVFNAMLAGDVAAYKDDPPAEREAATNISKDFNAQLVSKVNDLRFASDVQIFDMATVVNQIKAYSDLHGFSNVVDPCITNAAQGEFCSDITGYLFWDTVHMTSQAHRVVADLLDATLKSGSSLAVGITSPRNNATYAIDAPITVSAIALDNIRNISRVEFYDGDTLIDADLTLPYSITWVPDIAGEHLLKAKVFNEANQTVDSRLTLVTINSDNTLPTITLGQPVGDAGNVNGSIEAIAADADGSITKVEFYVDGNLFASLLNSPYLVSWTAAPNGNYQVMAKAYDDKNMSTDSNTVSLVVDDTLVSNQAPIVTLSAPVANTGNTQGSITANASDVDGSIERVEFYANGDLLGTIASAPYTFAWTSAPDGNYTVTVKAYDNAGLSTTSNVINVVVDNSL